MHSGDIVVKAVFRQRLEEIRADIKAGRIKFHNPPPEWTEVLLNITALSIALWLLAREAEWN